MKMIKQFRVASFCGHLRLALIVFLSTLAAHAVADPSSEILQRLHDATVYIESQMVLSSASWDALPQEVRDQFGKRPQGPASGSGFLISKDGLVVTNAHVVSEFTQPLPFGDQQLQLRFIPTSFKVVVRSGEDDEKTCYPKLVKIDEQLDLALLKIDAFPDIAPLRLNPIQEIKTGNQIFMAGFPGGKIPDQAPFADEKEILSSEKNPRVSINAGMVTSVRKSGGNVRYQLDVRANHGNSGGPIVNEAGEVIGILYAGIEQLQSISYAIPTYYLRRVLPGDTLASWGPGFGDNSGDSQTYDSFKDSGTFKIAQ